MAARVQVRIEWPSDLRTLPADAEAHVTVEDTTVADAGSVVLAEEVVRDLEPGRPVTTSVEVDDVDDRADLNVRVHVCGVRTDTRSIESGDLVSTRAHPVLTHGHGDSVVVPVRLVGG